jgi:rod shape-determining protein MreB and related proteins
MSRNTTLIHAGIDLGTSRSSITTSDGRRHVVESYVGWPADLVARKVLKKDVLIGREALDNRPMLDLHRPLEEGLVKEGSAKDLEAVRELLSHLLRLATESDNGRPGHPALADHGEAGDEEGAAEAAEAPERRIRAVVGVPAKALRVNKRQLRDTMQGLVDGLMIVSEPFAVAYGLDALLHTLIIDLGAGTSDFCVMRGRLPTEEDQRTLTAAGDWLDEQLAQSVRQQYPDAQFTIHMVREWKEKYSFVGPPQGRVMVTVPVAGKPTEIDITDAMRSACEALVPKLVETMLDLISRVDPEYQHQVRQNVVLTGGTGLIRGLGERLEAELEQIGGGRVRVIKDPVYVGSNGGLAIAQDAPEGDWDKLR